MTAIIKLKAALAALQANHEWHVNYDEHNGYAGSDAETQNLAAIGSLRSVIAEMEAGEPVGWANPFNLASASINRGAGDTHTWAETKSAYHTVPLFTHPQPKAEPDRPVEANKTMVEQRKLTPSQKDAERVAFEQWYVENAFNYERDPLGSKLCGDQWAAWKYRSAAPQAKPLTDAQIAHIVDSITVYQGEYPHAIARTVEAARGIKP